MSPLKINSTFLFRNRPAKDDFLREKKAYEICYKKWVERQWEKDWKKEAIPLTWESHVCHCTASIYEDEKQTNVPVKTSTSHVKSGDWMQFLGCVFLW